MTKNDTCNSCVLRPHPRRDNRGCAASCLTKPFRMSMIRMLLIIKTIKVGGNEDVEGENYFDGYDENLQNKNCEMYLHLTLSPRYCC